MKSSRIRLYRPLHTIARQIERVARGLYYVAAGTLRRDDLLHMSQRVWRDFNCSDAAIVAGLYAWERDVYERHVRPQDRMLIVGSGSGREALALAEAGHEVVGVEPVPEAVAAARRVLQARGHDVPIIQASIEDAALPGAFDVIVFSCYSYIPQSSSRVAVLRRAAAHLRPGGRVILTYIPALAPFRAGAVTLAGLMARLTRSDWRPERNDVLHQAAKQDSDTLEPLLYEHWFTHEEIEREARAAGLRVVDRWRRPLTPTLVLGV